MKNKEETMQTLHPKGKSSKKISIQKYESMKYAILAILKGKELTLFEALEGKLKGRFNGYISWYAETVKLDLEARKLIERTNEKPQKYHLK